MRQYRSVVCFKKSTVMSSSVRLSAQLIIVTGLSGSGKSIAIRQLEDSGYYCLDNLSAGLFAKRRHASGATRAQKTRRIHRCSQSGKSGNGQRRHATACRRRLRRACSLLDGLHTRTGAALFRNPPSSSAHRSPRRRLGRPNRSEEPSVWSENFWPLPHNTLTSSIPQGFCPTHYATGCARLPKLNSR